MRVKNNNIKKSLKKYNRIKNYKKIQNIVFNKLYLELCLQNFLKTIFRIALYFAHGWQFFSLKNLQLKSFKIMTYLHDIFSKTFIPEKLRD